AVALAAIAAGYLGATYGLRPVPFLLGIAFAVSGLLLSVIGVRESHGHARHEAGQLEGLAGQESSAARSADGADAKAGQRRIDRGDAEPEGARPAVPSFKDIFLLTSWRQRTLFAVSQTGRVNNLNDGLAWGIFPLFFAAGGLGVGQVGLLAGIY